MLTLVLGLPWGKKCLHRSFCWSSTGFFTRQKWLCKMFRQTLGFLGSSHSLFRKSFCSCVEDTPPVVPSVWFPPAKVTSPTNNTVRQGVKSFFSSVDGGLFSWPGLSSFVVGTSQLVGSIFQRISFLTLIAHCRFRWSGLLAVGIGSFFGWHVVAC